MSILKNKRGETIVEVLTSLVLFMMLLAVLTGAVGFASNAQLKAELLRDKAAELQLEARSGTPTGNDDGTYTFKAISLSGLELGTQELFKVNVKLQSIDADGTVFYVFGASD